MNHGPPAINHSCCRPLYMLRVAGGKGRDHGCSGLIVKKQVFAP